LCKISGKPGWWFFLFLIPILNIVILIIVSMKIAELRGRPGWVGILWVIPVIGIIVPGYLAFTD